MNEIKRWDIAALGNGFTGMKQRDDGAFVRNADHEAEVARLRAEISALKDDPSYETACETIRKLRAEVEGLRKTLGEVTQCLSDTVNEVGGWAVEEVIEAGMEAAMGASA